MRILGTAILFVLACAGCGEESASLCSVNADCASGLCLPNGSCGDADVTFQTADAADGATTQPGGDATSPGDAPPGSDAAGAGDAPTTGDGQVAPVVCAPNNDGTITRAEVPLAAGLSATYRIAQDVEVDTAGTGDGASKTWDVSTALSGDHDSLVEAADPAGFWFGTHFPTASYAARLADEGDLYGLFEITDDALLLLGVASLEDGLFATKLTYDPPVAALKFPLAVGATWSTTSTATGTTDGVISLVTETYDYEVTNAGTAVTPFASFPVLQVTSKLTRMVGLAPYTERQVLLVAECFGSVASFRSKGYESAVYFTDAAEVRRLAP